MIDLRICRISHLSPKLCRSLSVVLQKTFRISGLPSRAVLAVVFTACFACEWIALSNAIAMTGPAGSMAVGSHLSVAGVVGMSVRTVSFVSFAFPGTPSTLRDTVSGVVGIRAKKEVRGVDARRVVAVMENVQPFGNGADVQFPRDAMRQLSVARRSDHDRAVPLRVLTRSPYPTPGSKYRVNGAVHIDFLPETLSKRTTFHAHNLTRGSGWVNHVFIEET